MSLLSIQYDSRRTQKLQLAARSWSPEAPVMSRTEDPSKSLQLPVRVEGRRVQGVSH